MPPPGAPLAGRSTPAPEREPASQPASQPKRVAGVSVKVWLGIAAVAVVAIGAAVVIGSSGDDDTGTTQASPPVTVGATVTTPSTTEPQDSGESLPTLTTPATTFPNTTGGPGAETTVFQLPLEGEVAGAPTGSTGTAAAPVAAGQVADIGGNFRLQVLGVVPDATAQVLAADDFNEAPPAGTTYTLVRAALGYYGLDDPRSAFMPTITGVTAAGTELSDDCGFPPDELDVFTDLFAGGVVIGNLCFVTSGNDAATMQISAQGDFFADEAVFLQVAEPASATPLAPLRGPQPGAAATPARQAPTAIGTAVDVGEGWSVRVDGPARDITDDVLAQGSFNDPPPAGFRFVGIEVTYTFNGPGTDTAFTVTTSAVADGNVRLSFQCGVLPAALDEFSDVASGVSTSGTLCFVVPEGATGLTLYSQGGFDGTPVWFATD
jgi:hypothetical protein